MSIEFDLFSKSDFIEDKLIEYGFKKNDNAFTLTKYIINNTFRVGIEIIDNKLSGRIWDLCLNEEYINYKIDILNGEFVNKVREEYTEILIDIKNKCTIAKPFIFPQSNRIAIKIKELYGDDPVFPWDKFSGYGLFKNGKKWYALIANVNKSKIDKGNEEVEIINLKVGNEEREKLILREGFYNAYHMNKKYWISIILDGKVDDEEIIKYIKLSHSYTE